VQHPLHYGIHESAYFSYVDGRYGSLDNATNYVEFVEVMAASDYFRLAGADKDFLYSLWPTTYEAVLLAVMERFAAAKGAEYWVEKSPSHTLLAPKIAKLCPRAIFLGVTRDIVEVVNSALGGWLRSNPAASQAARQRLLLTTAVGWVLYSRALASFSRSSDRILIVRYDYLMSDLEGTFAAICDFIRTPFEPDMCRQAFPPNTSFPAGKRSTLLNRKETHLVQLIAGTFRYFPLSLLQIARARLRRRRPLPDWFFRLSTLGSVEE
jgi:hypothetical protein